MKIVELLEPERVLCRSSASSKKRVLEILSDSLAATLPGLTPAEVFDSLIARERLGSTGLGRGVAIPHARVDSIKDAAAAFLKLDQGVDYDAPDAQPVDLLFALLVPRESTEEHLALLAQLAEIFAEPQCLSQLREADDPQTLLGALSRQESRFVTSNVAHNK